MAGRPRAVFLMGPTGSGKTDLALQFYDRMPCHLISVDSALVYRQMDIGTAKPDPAVLARYPHALVDIRDPAEPYSVSDFLQDARDQLALALDQGKTPVFVGGTMLYFKALREGLAELPAADRAVRKQLEARAGEEGWPALHAELAKVDPQSAARLHPNHSARIQRALEVWMQTGVPLSEWHKRGSDGGIMSLVDPLQIAILPGNRDALHQRLQLRLEKMLEAGLVEEVRQLRERGDLTPDLPSMRAVGYRQVWDYLNGQCSREAVEEAVLVATRQLAKRQMTWLRSWPDLLPVDPLDEQGKWRNNGDLIRDCLKFW